MTLAFVRSLLKLLGCTGALPRVRDNACEACIFVKRFEVSVLFDRH
jgi:hypothetical protein